MKTLRRSIVGSAILVLMVAGVLGRGLLAQQAQPPRPAPVPGLSASARAQIRALAGDKFGRNWAQKKINSRLLYAAQRASGAPLRAGMPVMDLRIPSRVGNLVEVDVRANVTADFLAQVRALGATVVHATPAYGSVRVQLGLNRLEALAALPDVGAIKPSMHANVSRFDGAPTAAVDRGAARTLRRDEIAGLLRNAVAQFPGGQTNTGSVRSEGDTTHQVAIARANFAVDGTGVKIGVLSDGVDGLAASQASGDVGPVTVLPGQAGSGAEPCLSAGPCAEGTALLEILHDLAPGASLYFATANPTIEQFAQNIHDLRAAGCDIIIDDTYYFQESPFVDGQTNTVYSTFNAGIVTQAINEVTADGAMYFSSAGNDGNTTDATSGTWEGDYVNGGAAGGVLAGAGNAHDFGGGQTYDVVNKQGQFTVLWWADPLGRATNDYDLYVLDSTGTNVVDSSTEVQNGFVDPVEAVSAPDVGQRIVIVNCNNTGAITCDGSAAPRFLGLYMYRGRLSMSTPGALHGHPMALNAFAVAATPAATAFGTPTPDGPYPSSFTSTNQIEKFSSDGPRRIFFHADNTPITSGNFSSSGGLLRQKPDVTAADGVSVTANGGFHTPFYGTSAATPHAAAIAALVKSLNYNLTADDVRSILINHTIDIMAAGADRDAGWGIVMANDALANTPVPGSTLTRSPTSLHFAAIKNGAGGAILQVTPAQTVTVGYAGSAPAWTATPDQSWLQVINGSGTGLRQFTVTIVNPSNVIGGDTSLSANIWITSATANPVVIPVTLSVQQVVGVSNRAFGEVDTPAQGATGVAGMMMLTGWALDDIGVSAVQVYRSCFPAFDVPASCQTIGADRVVFIGNATFIAGARPDVEGSYPNYPLSYRAGWGLGVLTSSLPNVPGQRTFGGQGTMQFYAYAIDQEGNRTLLGRNPSDRATTSVTFDNDHIAKPFGNLDTPVQNALVNGTIPVFGWALTPDSDTVSGNQDTLINTDGSTMVVYVDGQPVGSMTYNQCRGTVGNPPSGGAFCNDDVASEFGNAVPQPTFTPRLSNPTKFRNLDASRGAIASFLLNTTTLTDGQHTIGFLATDTASRADAIGGGRTFIVANGGGSGLSSAQISDIETAPAKNRGPASMLTGLQISARPVSVRTGFNTTTISREIDRTTDNVRTVTIPVTGRLEVSFQGVAVTSGYLVTNGQLRDLPVGSHLDQRAGVFTWAPPAGYLGVYRLAFLVGGERILVDVTVTPRGDNSSDGRSSNSLSGSPPPGGVPAQAVGR